MNYQDGREIREGDVGKHRNTGMIARATGKNPENFTPGCMHVERADGDSGSGYMDICNFTLLRRANEFKVGDEIKWDDGTEQSDGPRTIKVVEKTHVYFTNGFSMPKKHCTLIKPVEDIDPSGYHEDSAAMNAEQGFESTKQGGGKCRECGRDIRNGYACNCDGTHEQISDKPPWLARAESKDFEAGDMLFVQSDGAVFIDYSGVKRHPVARRFCSLLRPHDWVPQVGDRVVCIEAEQPSVFELVDHDALCDRWLIRGGHGQYLDASASIAPAELAEPLIPLLRGEGTKTTHPLNAAECSMCGGSHDAITVCSEGRLCETCFDRVKMAADVIEELAHAEHPCPRHETTGCTGSIESGECDACGWPGLRDMSPPDIFIPDTCNRKMMDRYGREWTGSDLARGGIGSFEPGETIPQQKLRTRWTADFPRTTKHCRLCGRDGGCGCGKEYC